MQILGHPSELLARGRKICLAIGMFDGVHLGHQQVIRQTINDARQYNGFSVAVTFDKHPKAIVAPEKTPPLIHTLPQKLRAIGSLGVDAALVIPFTPEFSRLPGDVFIRDLATQFCNVHGICVGSNFTFGFKRSGNVNLLKQLGAEHHFVVHSLAAVALDGETVSSTRIRQTIVSGDFDAASQMLGRAYSLAGRVDRGDGIGHKLGFPTANVNISGLAVPPRGVYATHAKIENDLYSSATNIGFRPTLNQTQPELRVESHLLDFDSDLYGKELELFFVSRLREEKRFSSVEELKAQIADDVEATRTVLQ